MNTNLGWCTLYLVWCIWATGYLYLGLLIWYPVDCGVQELEEAEKESPESEELLRKWESTMLITSITTIILIMRRVVTITITSIELSDGGGQLGTVEVAANPMPPTIHHFNYKSILIIPQLIIQDWACKFWIVKYVVFEGYDQTFLILMILITDDWLVTSGYLRWSHGLSARIRVWRIYSNIRIYWSRIYIRTFVRINFYRTQVNLGSDLWVRIRVVKAKRLFRGKRLKG